jgi:hypothetical protein
VDTEPSEDTLHDEIADADLVTLLQRGFIGSCIQEEQSTLAQSFYLRPRLCCFPVNHFGWIDIGDSKCSTRILSTRQSSSAGLR